MFHWIFLLFCTAVYCYNNIYMYILKATHIFLTLRLLFSDKCVLLRVLKWIILIQVHEVKISFIATLKKIQTFLTFDNKHLDIYSKKSIKQKSDKTHPYFIVSFYLWFCNFFLFMVQKFRFNFIFHNKS